MTEKKTGGKRALSIVRPSVIATTFSSRSIKFAKQQRLNGIIAAVYAAQAIALWVIGRSATAPVSVSYLARDSLQSTAQHHTLFMLAQHHLFDVSLLGLMVIWLFASALFHGLLATALRERYERALTSGLNDLRWGGYAVLGSFVAVLVGFVLGVSDVAVSVSVIALCVLISYGAMAVEANKRLWPWALFPGIAAVAAILALGSYLLGGFLYGDARSIWVYAASAVPTLTAIAITANLWMQIRAKNKWQDYLFAETIYVCLGFVASSLLAWAVFAGVLR